MMTPTSASADASRVALVCDYALDYLGGAQTALAQQAAALRGGGVEVTVIAPSQRHAGRVHTVAGAGRVEVPARVTVPGVRLPVVRNSAALRHRLERVLREREIQAVHLHSELGIAAAALDVARRLGIPVVHTVHTFFWRTDLPVQRALGVAVPLFHRWLTGLSPSTAQLADRPGDSALRGMTLTVARQADVVVSPSAHQAASLRAAGLDRVVVVPNTLGAIPAVRPLDRVTGPLRLVWVGRCVAEKRPLPFVRSVVAALDRLGPGLLEVHVVGDGEQLSAARQAAGRRSEVIFHGRVDHDNVQRLLGDAHATVLTSYGFDNQPMTVVESVMALRGVVYCDPALTEGLQGPGLRTSGPSDGALTDLLVSLARDPRPVVAASRAAVAARDEFAPETFVTRIRAAYAMARQSARTAEMAAAARPGAS